ncbi:Heat shock 70 kDa protein 1 [Hypsibius exemplaris]|uniref:Heat shock 70 kDa protein 1 n=1 Tax=Hypsibius exemplaris TaxID=2072580 RepID=A0A1W0WZI2_HYPEX|nr:Heat shock 70 kDa protein 1 [Hypsibius exemplaris]
MPDDVVIGIDLGTTYSCAAVFRNGKAVAIPNAFGTTTIPSYVAYENDTFIAGHEAKDNASANPNNTVFAIKRIIGRRFDEPEVALNRSRWPFEVVNTAGKPSIQLTYDGELHTVNPEDISAEILRALKRDAEDFLNTPVERAVITVPANFSAGQKKATQVAGEKAGLKVIGVINEPTAAAVAYGIENRAKGGERATILVFDFGGGTLDVTILKAQGHNVFKVLTTQGNTQLGGEDFDQRIMEKLVADFEREHGSGLAKNASAMTLVRREAEKGKRTLSTPAVKKARFAIQSLHNRKPMMAEMTREEFENLCSDLYPKVLIPVKEALRSAGLKPSDIHQVVLVGGSSKMLRIQAMLADYFSEEQIFRNINPDEAIAYGAAVFAHSLSEEDSLVEVEDVISSTLGLELDDKSLLAVLKKDTPYPVERRQELCTARDNQKTAVFKIYEGENLKVAAQNKLWATLLLTNIRQAKAGEVTFTVTFNYDVRGMLHADVKEDGNHVNKANIEIQL